MSRSKVIKKSSRVMEKPAGYVSTPELVKMLGVCKMTIYRWVEKGYIHPSEEYSRGNRFLFEENLLTEDLKKNCGCVIL